MTKRDREYKENLHIIDSLLERKRRVWQLKALAWMDFDDVAQMIRLHIYNKWDKWDQARPFGPWCNRVIGSQMKNISRDNYSNFVRPCVSCPFNQSKGSIDGENLCGYTKSGHQTRECPMYAKWEASRKNAYDVKLPLPLENHSNEVFSRPEDLSLDIEDCMKKLKVHMKKHFNKRYLKAYEMLYQDKKSDEEVASFMGYRTSEEGRTAGYRQIKNLKQMFTAKAKEIIFEEDIVP